MLLYGCIRSRVAGRSFVMGYNMVNSSAVSLGDGLTRTSELLYKADDMSDERIVNPDSGEEDQQVEKSLRPKRLSEFIGQEKVVELLQIAIAAAKGRAEPLDHTLLYGPPGLGKTSLAGVLANEMGVNFKLTSGPAIERPGDLAAVLTNLQKDDILFIDEIHRLNRTIEEVLYPAMEDFALDIMVGKGPSARNLRLKLPKFTTIGATTRVALLTSPLRDRFGSTHRMEFYSHEALYQIVVRSATILGVQTTDDGAREIASRARGTPRIVNRLLRRVRDYAQVVGGGVITREVARAALARLEVDELGLDENDRRLLRALIELFNGGPVGLSTLAAALAEEIDAIEDVYEPFLLQLGFLHRTPRGRVATRRAYEHLGIPFVERVAADGTEQTRLW
jgi:holliday junction DNA helicase RuvB